MTVALDVLTSSPHPQPAAASPVRPPRPKVGPADWRNNYLIDCRLVQSRPDLSPSHKELLLQLLHDQHRHGCTCASWAELGERMGLNPKNVKRGLRSLEMKVRACW